MFGGRFARPLRVTTGTPDECEPDSDSDGSIDGCDNCPESPNPGQEDIDSDGLGDACDPVNDIPAVSQWGIMILALLLIAAGSIATARRSREAQN